jgi:hypothetical protein
MLLNLFHWQKLIYTHISVNLHPDNASPANYLIWFQPPARAAFKCNLEVLTHFL